MEIARYAIDFEMSDGTTKTVEFEVPEGSMEGYLHTDGRRGMDADLKMQGHRIREVADPVENGDAVNLAYTKKVGNPHNLLDNSDFRNPVNQRGRTTLTGAIWDFIVDRWYISLDNGETAELTANGLSVSGDYSMQQRFVKGYLRAGAVYTSAIYYSDGSVELSNAPYLGESDFDYLSVSIKGNKTVACIALYEGEYTAESIPEYQPKGYAAELAECRRHYRSLNIRTFGIGYTKTKFAVHMLLDTPMRVKPTVTVESCKFYNTNSWTYDEISSYLSGNPATGTDFVSLYFELPNDTFVENTAYNIHPLKITLDAGL